MKLVFGKNGQRRVPVVTKEIEKLPALGLLRAKDANGKLVNSKTESQIMDFTGVTDVDSYMLAYAYRNNTAISGAVDMSDLTTITGNGACSSMFQNCTGLTSVDLSSLTTMPGSAACNSMFQGCAGLTSVDLSSLTTLTSSQACANMFASCTGITSIDLSNLTTISGGQACNYMFYNCTGLVSVDLSSLESLTGNQAMNQCFSGCTSLTSMTFSSLSTATGGANGLMQYCFQNCTALTYLSFPALRSDSFGTRNNQFNNMLSGVTGCTVHFPSNIQSVIGSWASVTGGFSGTNTTVLFDLPATVTLTGANSVDYQRDPNYDTGTALAWYNETDGYDVPFYTSGTSDPTTGATIYSDSACTTAVTTISSIA